MPMSKEGLGLGILKNQLGLKKPKEDTGLCEITIKGTPEMILSLMGRNNGENNFN